MAICFSSTKPYVAKMIAPTNIPHRRKSFVLVRKFLNTAQSSPENLDKISVGQIIARPKRAVLCMSCPMYGP